jgi:hypothetical protein
MISLLRTLFFIVVGWYLVKWLVRWISGGNAEAEKGGKADTSRYEKLTDQKIDDADYEDL